MKKYMQILNGKANPIVIEDNKVDELRAHGVEIIDVADMNPMPQAGWSYDPETKTFIEPPIVPVDPDTTISNTALWNRFTQEEKENLLSFTSKKVKVFLYEMRLKPSFDLADPKLINAIKALGFAGIIGAGRADEILKR